MRYALNNKKKKIEVELSGQKANCTICNAEVIGKKGEIKVKHWAHKRMRDCDDWWEPVTEWHLEWQNHFPEKNREVVISNGTKSHRADIRLDNGLVIEIQNSAINRKNIKSREIFYGLNNMIWILNGQSLAQHSELQMIEYPYRYYFIIEFSKNLPNNPNYLTENFFKGVEGIFGSEKSVNIQRTSDKIIFSSLDDIRIKDSLKLIHFKYYVTSFYQDLYGNIDAGTFNEGIKISNKIVPIDLKKKNLVKKYWRNFIDSIGYPVFIDELKGLEADEIYWYQKNKVYKKEEFLQKYLKHTTNQPQLVKRHHL